LKGYWLPTGSLKLRELVAKWRTALVEARATEPREAKALYTALLQPAAQAGLLKPGRYTRIAAVGDGPLADIPFGALAGPDGSRLIERYAISASVSFGVLTWPASGRKPSASMLLAVDPVEPSNNSDPKELTKLATRGGLGPLKHARAESRRVGQLFPGSVALVGEQAREAIFKRDAGKYRFLHFATHGVLDPHIGLSSWLLLAAEKPDSAEDGRLEAREVLSMPLSAELAVLSACEAARGEQGGGDGLLGLAWSFRAAGCPSVVASHWKVDDAATAGLMGGFYRALKAGKRRDTALREAMLALRKNPAYAKPFYWAAFTLLGDSGTISVAGKKTRGRG
jgi:CHAT domain-containing protein